MRAIGGHYSQYGHSTEALKMHYVLLQRRLVNAAARCSQSGALVTLQQGHRVMHKCAHDTP